MTMTYTTVGIGRIQSHLARSRHLWGRRGASEELVTLTMLPEAAKQLGFAKEDLANLAVQRVLDAYSAVNENPEGLDIDGVVSLKSADHDAAIAASNMLAGIIRDRLPASTITVSWVDSTDPYASLLGPAKESQWTKEVWYPLAYEFPLVRPCDECHVSGASRRNDIRGESLRLCDDCWHRWEILTDNNGVEKPLDSLRSKIVVTRMEDYPPRFSAEWWLLERLSEDLGSIKVEAVADFEELGQIERPDGGTEDNKLRTRTHEGNHIALIFADGNGIGGLFNKALKEAAQEESTKKVQKTSASIKAATASALLEASKVIIFDEDTKCPVIPHINGGDDVLVSVTADRAWAFLHKFLDSLKESFGDKENESFQDHDISMSAGMVICKAEYPFANQVELAEALMRRAKAKVHGNGWSFAWLDLTHDGPTVEAHSVWTLEKLISQMDAITHLRSKITAHGESALTGALAEDKKSRGVRLAHLADRMPEVKKLLELVGVTSTRDITEEQVALLNDIASIGRWWR